MRGIGFEDISVVWGAWVCMGKLILQIFWGFVLYGKLHRADSVQILLGFVMYKESYMQMYIIGLYYACDSQIIYRAARNIEIFWDKESRNLFCCRQESIEKHTDNSSFVVLIWGNKIGIL